MKKGRAFARPSFSGRVNPTFFVALRRGFFCVQTPRAISAYLQRQIQIPARSGGIANSVIHLHRQFVSSQITHRVRLNIPVIATLFDRLFEIS
jgi:hypothetical protein